MKPTLQSVVGLMILLSMGIGLTGCFFRGPEPRHDDRVIIDHHDDHHDDWHDDHR